MYTAGLAELVIYNAQRYETSHLCWETGTLSIFKRCPSKYAFTWSCTQSVNCAFAWPSETWVCKEEIFILSFKWSFSPPQNRPAVERLSRLGAKAARTCANLSDTEGISPTADICFLTPQTRSTGSRATEKRSSLQPVKWVRAKIGSLFPTTFICLTFRKSIRTEIFFLCDEIIKLTQLVNF